IRNTENQVCCAKLSSRPLSRRTLRNRSAGVSPVSRAGCSCHGSTASPSRENALRLPRSEIDKIADVVKDSRRDQNQAIEAIQQTAMPRNDLRCVFET